VTIIQSGVKTYSPYTISFMNLTQETVKACKVTSGKHTLTFHTKTGTQTHEWSDVLGFIRNADAGLFPSTGDLLGDIFDNKPRKWVSRLRFGRVCFRTLTVPHRLVCEANRHPLRQDCRQLRLSV
jgi:hypothetical protein